MYKKINYHKKEKEKIQVDLEYDFLDLSNEVQSI